MNLAEVVEQMRLAGCTKKQIGSVVDGLVGKRSANAVRQARFRANKQAKPSVIVTPHSPVTITPEIVTVTGQNEPSRIYARVHSGAEEEYIEPNGSTPKVPKPETNSDFTRFWEPYPHKVGKPAALRAFASAAKKSAYSLQAILDGLNRYLANKPSDRPWLNPATFLNQERWNDRPGAVKNGRANGHKPSTLDIFHRISNGTYEPRNSGGLFDDEGADADATIIDGVAFEVCRSN